MFERMNASRRIWGAAMVLLLAATASFAASPLVGGGNQGGGDESLERELEGGIRITLVQMVRDKEDKDWIWAQFSVEPEQDTVITVQGGEIFDADGNRFNPRNDWNHVGNERTSSREIIGGIKTKVLVGYSVGRNYGKPVFVRLAFSFNEKAFIFRGKVPTQDAQ